MRFIVTGTPRSATRYGAKLLDALRVPCTHEHTLRPLAPVVDVLRWWREAKSGESSWMAWTLLPVMPTSVPVLHTIRDPWLVIDSLANRNSILRPDQLQTDVMTAIRRIIDAYLPEVFLHATCIDRAAAFVLGWNRLIGERVPDRCVYHVDRLDVPMVRNMLEYLGVSRSDTDIANVLAAIPTEVNGGYSIEDSPRLSDPVVARWIEQYAKEHNFAGVVTRRMKDVPDRQTPAELAARMTPGVLDRVNEYASRHGYQAMEVPQLALVS